MKKFSILIMLVCLVTTLAAQAGLYRWVDSKGKIHFSDQVPPDQAKHDREQLNSSGRVVETYDGTRTPDQLAEKRRLEKLARDEAAKKQAEKDKDRVLVMTYQSSAEIIAAGEVKVTTVQLDIEITESRVKNQKVKLRELRKKAAGYERNSNAVPKPLLRSIAAMKKRIADLDGYIKRKQQEKEVIRSEFLSYVMRYKELTE